MPTLLYKLTLSFLLVTVAQLVSSDVMSQDTIIQENDKEIIIRKKPRSGDKVTIVIDGDRVIMNGKEIMDLGDVQVDIDRIQQNVERSMRSLNRNMRSLERNFHFAPVAPVPPVPPVPPAFSGEVSNRARLGVYTEKDEKGAKIKEVVEGSPAQQAGLQKGDIITAVGKKDITDPASLSEAIGAMQAGDEVEIKYVRNKKQQKASIKLDSHGFQSHSFYFRQLGDNFTNGFQGFAEAWNRPQLGIRIQDTEEGNGVKVLELDSESIAAKAGIEKDDLVTAIDGKEITNTDEARRQLAAVRNKSAFPVRLQRGNSTKEIEIKIPKKLKTTDL